MTDERPLDPVSAPGVTAPHGASPAGAPSVAAPPAGAPSAGVSPSVAAPPDGLPAGDVSLLALVDRLAILLERSDLTELEVEAGGTAILLRKAGALATAAAPSMPDAPAGPRSGDAAAPVPGGGPTGGAPAPSRSAVLAPLTGIFYAAPSPGSPPFVEVGREVVVGQVIGLIEAMKLFNEIKSDRAGRVVRVIPDNGTLVKAKHPLIEVEPL